MSKDIGGRRRMGCRIAFFQLFEHLFLSRPQDRDQQRRIVQDQRAGHRDTELMGFGMLGNGVITAVRQHSGKVSGKMDAVCASPPIPKMMQSK